jgi:hypothetical protein
VPIVGQYLCHTTTYAKFKARAQKQIGVEQKALNLQVSVITKKTLYDISAKIVAKCRYTLSSSVSRKNYQNHKL